MPERVALYLRVSTRDQTVDNQRLELLEICQRNGWQVVAEYADEGISGIKGRDERPGLDALMKDAMRRRFDRVAVWSVDRLGRSLKHLVFLLEDLKQKNVPVYAHKQGIDTTTPTGMMMWSFLSVFSGFERDLIRDRVKAGMARARTQGKRIGRPNQSDLYRDKVLQLRAAGNGKVKIARTLGIGTSQVQRILSQTESSSLLVLNTTRSIAGVD